MRSEIKARGLNAQHMERILHLAASLIELGYHNCTFEEKKLIAQFNWFGYSPVPRIRVYNITAPKNVETYITFEERFLRNLPQLDPALQGLADVLRSMHDYYPVFFANSIINATFEFVAGTCLEPAFEKVDVSTTSTRFPWFLRDRTGVAVAFALMLFPNSQKVEYAACFSAMADMDYWISITNDLLSYYKESLAGETANYISNRASVEGVASLQVVADLQYELLESRNHIYKLLRNNAGEKAVKIWRVWEHGYVIKLTMTIQNVASSAEAV
ncbi:hypothetical protein H0H92_006698 [Tricholoma furcatifolium]|nr:hypothetical protein H0H92_006698 [Tricholoma furcatifolium]